MAMANSAMAQDYDDRWYLTAGAGYGFFDSDRNVNDEFYGTLGFGRFFSPNCRWISSCGTRTRNSTTIP
jgi:OOP family OmpA-OmpF porin